MGKTSVPADPLAPCTLPLVPTPPRWRWQEVTMANGRENVHRVGGYPYWIQNAEYPPCPGCDRPTPFLLQLDVGLPVVGGGTWDWGPYGMGYVHWCDDCRISAIFVQF